MVKALLNEGVGLLRQHRPERQRDQEAGQFHAAEEVLFILSEWLDSRH